MKIGSYKTTYLNADDVSEPTVITIANVVEEKVGTEQKLVMYTEELDQAIALGKTTLIQLEEIFGSDETDDWNGQKVIVFNDRSVQFQGKKVGGLRFRAFTPDSKAKAPSKKATRDAEFPGH